MKRIHINGSNHLTLVTTVNFSQVIEIGDPVSQAKIYEAQSADELIFLDLDASADNRPDLIQSIKKVSEEIFMPITVGGGISCVEDFRELLISGADKISINSAAVLNPQLISDAARMFGRQCVVLSIDYKKTSSGENKVFIHGGKKETDLYALDWALEGERLGAGEILITCIDRDGTRSGLDIGFSQQICSSVSVPVIVSGGCGLTRHFVDGFVQGKADAISAGTFFCFKDENPLQVRSQIKNAGIPIRINT